MTAPSLTRAFGWTVPLSFIAALIVFFRLAYPLLNDNDVPWHMATGTWMLEHHQLPVTDPFAYGNQNQPWFILSWLWDVMLGMAQMAGGPFAAFIMTITIGAALVAAIIQRLLAMEIALPAVMMTGMLFALCMLDYLTARPQLIGYAMALCFHAVLHKSRNSRNGAVWPLGWLPVLMLIWSNAHGSFMVGFIMLGVYGFEALVTRKHEWMRRLVFTAVACGVCALINPYGAKVVLGTLTTLGGSSTKYNTEWMPFSFATSTGLSLWLVILLLASNLRYAGVAMADKILTVMWFLAAMFSIRNGAFFIILSAPYLATCIDEQTQGLRKTPPLTPFALFMNRQKLTHVWTAAAALWMAVVAVLYAIPHADKVESDDYSIKDAIDYANQHYADHQFLTDYSFGGQVMYHTQGHLAFFMDSRAGTAYSDEAIREYLDFLRLAPGWEKNLAQRHLNGIIMSNNSNFAANQAHGAFEKRWKLVFAGKRANVYIARP